MTTQIILSKSNLKAKVNYAYNLDTAGWIMAGYKEQRPVKIELTKYEGRTNFYCEFETRPEEKCNYREFIRLREEHLEQLLQTIATGLKQLAGCLRQAKVRDTRTGLMQINSYLAVLRERLKNASALNTKRKPRESAGVKAGRKSTKKIAAQNKTTEAAYV